MSRSFAIALKLLAALWLTQWAGGQVPVNGLIAHYPFNGNTQDASGSGLTLAVQGSVLAADRTGRPDSAYSFALTSGAPNTTSLRSTANFPLTGNAARSVSIWFRLDGEPAYPYGNLICWGTNTTGGAFALVYEPWASPANNFSINCQNVKWAWSSPTNLPVGQWHHIVLTYSTNLGGARLYLNGAELPGKSASPQLGSATTTINTGSGPLRINDFLGEGHGIAGRIDDLRIYNRVLSAAEVAALFIAESTPAASTPPVITTQPTAQSIAVGSTAALTVAATGSAPLSYQWLRNGLVLTGATTASYTILNATTADAGTYTVLVLNAQGTVSSNPVTVTVASASSQSAPTTGLALFLPFSDQTSDSSPARRTITASNVTFGPGPNSTLTRAAYFDGQLSRLDFSPNLPSTNELTLSMWIRNTREGPGLGHVFVDWDDAAGNDTGLIVQDGRVGLFANKNGASLGWTSADQVLRPSLGWRHLIWVMTATASRLYLDGTLYAEVSQTGSNTGFKLRSNIGYFNYAGGRDYFQGFISNLRIYERALTPTEVGQLYGAESTTTSNSAPTVSTHPASQTLQVGQPLQLSVTAVGAAPLTYQWLRNGTVLSGATTASYAVANATPTDAGTYTVLVQNAAGAIYSNPATVTVGNPAPTVVAPAITTQPQGRTVDTGTAVTFTVVASGTEPLAYQWLRNNATVPGATTASLRIASAGSGDAGTYTVRVTNDQGAVVSTPATLVVNQLAVQVNVTINDVAELGGTGSNDLFVNRLPFPAAGGTLNGSNTGATRESGEPSHDGFVPVRSVWYSWTATVSGNVTISTARSSFDTVLAVYTGDTLGSLRGVVSNDDDGDALTSRVIFGATAGITYQIAVDGYNGASGSVTIALTAPAGSGGGPQNSGAPGVGSRVSLTATASPAGTYRYQWLRNGQPLAGQTGATLTIGFATPTDSGSYACVVTNAAGTSLTSPARQLQVSTGSNELRIVNSSTRLFVGTGDQVLITGLVLEGSGARSLLVRAVGPGLNPFGVAGTLGDPQLTVYDSARRVVATNDDWTASLGPIMAAAGAFPLPTASRDSALVVSLPAGAYTFMVSGANNTSGIALLEVYELP